MQAIKTAWKALKRPAYYMTVVQKHIDLARFWEELEKHTDKFPCHKGKVANDSKFRTNATEPATQCVEGPDSDQDDVVLTNLRVPGMVNVCNQVIQIMPKWNTQNDDAKAQFVVDLCGKCYKKLVLMSSYEHLCLRTEGFHKGLHAPTRAGEGWRRSKFCQITS